MNSLINKVSIVVLATVIILIAVTAVVTTYDPAPGSIYRFRDKLMTAWRAPILNQEEHSFLEMYSSLPATDMTPPQRERLFAIVGKIEQSPEGMQIIQHLQSETMTAIKEAIRENDSWMGDDVDAFLQTQASFVEKGYPKEFITGILGAIDPVVVAAAKEKVTIYETAAYNAAADVNEWVARVPSEAEVKSEEWDRAKLKEVREEGVARQAAVKEVLESDLNRYGYGPDLSLVEASITSKKYLDVIDGYISEKPREGIIASMWPF